MVEKEENVLSVLYKMTQLGQMWEAFSQCPQNNTSARFFCFRQGTSLPFSSTH